jgi:hypothetical protein
MCLITWALANTLGLSITSSEVVKRSGRRRDFIAVIARFLFHFRIVTSLALSTSSEEGGAETRGAKTAKSKRKKVEGRKGLSLPMIREEIERESSEWASPRVPAASYIHLRHQIRVLPIQPFLSRFRGQPAFVVPARLAPLPCYHLYSCDGCTAHQRM